MAEYVQLGGDVTQRRGAGGGLLQRAQRLGGGCVAFQQRAGHQPAEDPQSVCLARALAGRFAEARRLLADTTACTPRRFTLPELTALVEQAGLRAGETHGLRIFGGLVPAALLEGDAAATEALRALEEAAASTPPLRDIAAQLHLLGHR